jgi:hypothetical protein
MDSTARLKLGKLQGSPDLERKGSTSLRVFLIIIFLGLIWARGEAVTTGVRVRQAGRPMLCHRTVEDWIFRHWITEIKEFIYKKSLQKKKPIYQLCT